MKGLTSMLNNTSTRLTINEKVAVKTIDGVFRLGTIAAFGEHTVVISCGAYRYLARKEELLKLGYKLPPYKKKLGEKITRGIMWY